MAAQTTLKRRATTSKDGPPQKKAIISKSKTVARKGGAARPKDDPIKKRRVPITAPLNAPNEDESEGDDDEFGADDGADLENDAMNVDSPNLNSQKDPNASRESHKQQRELQKQRQALKPNFSLLAEAKQHWGLARQNTITREERLKHVANLMTAVRGKVQDVVFKHDASRVIQTIVKSGSAKERDEIAVELKGKYRDLAQDKYAKFLVTKILRYCPTHRASIIGEFQFHVIRLLLHREASIVIADAYELYSNAPEKDMLVRDFYGKEVALFADGKVVDGKAAKRGLEAVLAGADAERRRRVIQALRDNLFNIFNNPDKGAVPHAIVHHALWEYLQEVNKIEDEAEQDKTRREMLESCQELVAEMVHTKDGSRVVREFLAQGSAKDRKQIIKTLKPHTERMCKDEEAQLVLFTALDVVDDTKLVGKSIVGDIVAHASTFAFDTQKGGRRALLYLLVPRASQHFTPATIRSISETDAARSRTSKKDPEVRVKEIRVAASQGLLQLVVDKAEEVCRDPGASLLAGEIMLFTEGDKTAAIDALLEPISRTYPTPIPSNGELMHVIDVAHSSRLYKLLLQGGHFDRTTGSVTKAPSEFFSPLVFATAFIKSAGRENIVKMATGNGAFVVTELVERINAEGSAEQKKLLKGWFSTSVRKEVEEGKGKGSSALLEKLQSLTL